MGKDWGRAESDTNRRRKNSYKQTNKKYLFQGLNLKREKILDLGDEGWRVYMPWYVMRYGGERNGQG